jgi:hypothetical protein
VEISILVLVVVVVFGCAVFARSRRRPLLPQGLLELLQLVLHGRRAVQLRRPASVREGRRPACPGPRPAAGFPAAARGALCLALPGGGRLQTQLQRHRCVPIPLQISDLRLQPRRERKEKIRRIRKEREICIIESNNLNSLYPRLQATNRLQPPEHPYHLAPALGLSRRSLVHLVQSLLDRELVADRQQVVLHAKDEQLIRLLFEKHNTHDNTRLTQD